MSRTVVTAVLVMALTGTGLAQSTADDVLPQRPARQATQTIDNVADESSSPTPVHMELGGPANSCSECGGNTPKCCTYIQGEILCCYANETCEQCLDRGESSQ